MQAQTLADNGYNVTLIAPRGPGQRLRERVGRIQIYRFQPSKPSHSAATFAREFTQSWSRSLRLLRRVHRRTRIDVLQGCNPPDTIWAMARFLPGTRFVFDQHDLNPELFMSRFGAPSSPWTRQQLAALLTLERWSYRTAVHVIVPNESYRDVARRRGRRARESITIVRSAPDTRTMRPVQWVQGSVPPALTQIPGDRHVVAYLGVMGPQDGVDQLLDCIDLIVHGRGRRDVHAVLMGFGDCLEELREQASRLGIDDHVTFTGAADAEMIAHVLSRAEVGLIPDRLTDFTDRSTMNKAMEYMAYAVPVVGFDLRETRRTVGHTGVLVAAGDVEALADEVIHLLDNDTLRVRLGVEARRRVASDIDWADQARVYVGVFDDLMGLRREPVKAWPDVDRRHVTGGLPPGVIDLRDHRGLEVSLTERRAVRSASR
jgi:glycosyltransferase involved in cell wall biosynthesis